MDLNTYQQRALETCMPSCYNFSYMMLNLVGEVGELASKIAKHIRKGEMEIDRNTLCLTDAYAFTPKYNALREQQDVVGAMRELMSEEFRKHAETNMADQAAIKGELGDILWQLSSLCYVMGYTLDDIAKSNLAKLASRKERGVIDGNGDNR